ncbi:hypothetical protein [Alkaliphilus hydrothermalis]|uniref:YdhG-like domain-containing protein n=1 Tax=Alkaliphilus hydrothermalis TaxID=1482730 RepID=A0ABS2NT57_9FIRM|nr:hypothetical protein [Alkaliphilus hydrothermalis]MBM7616140.1 hypothetical protein [Alkaliphilus hydrothermalis]
MPEDIKKDIFIMLKTILKHYEGQLTVVNDSEDIYYLDAGIFPKTQKVLFFGSVQIKKSYVSYHLMPVYVFPELLQDISSKLRKRMQGKSCFNFNRVDESLFMEIEELTSSAFQKYKDNNILP